MEGHIDEDPPKEAEERKRWDRTDARLYNQITNSMNDEIVDLVSHCSTVKELMTFVEFLYSGKEQVTRTYDVCTSYFHADRNGESLMDYYTKFKRNGVELNSLMPFSVDIAVQQAQREKMGVISFLKGLGPEYENARSQILSGTELPSLDDVFRRLQRTEGNVLEQSNSALFGRNDFHGGRNVNPHVSKSGYDRRQDTSGNRRPEARGEMTCYDCYKPGHIKRDCRKLHVLLLKIAMNWF